MALKLQQQQQQNLQKSINESLLSTSTFPNLGISFASPEREIFKQRSLPFTVQVTANRQFGLFHETQSWNRGT